MRILNWSNDIWFDAYKLEKDFLLTMILIKFGEKYSNLIFKWGTCLNKIYLPYFRLSEDLDFVINMDWWRSIRKNLLRKYENYFVEDLKKLWVTIKEERNKFDEYRLAIFNFEYKSIINNSTQTIKIDISLKNNLQLPAISKEIKSIFKDKILEENIFGIHHINCITLKESTAEKMRASLTRRDPAIRDFFDIWYIEKYSDFDFESESFKQLVNLKLQETGYAYTIENNYDLLKNQIDTDLKPVLNQDFKFDLNEIYKFVLTYKK